MTATDARAACTAIIVSYGAGPELGRALEAYEAAGIPAIVVENGRRHDADVASRTWRYLHGHGNLGYGRGINHGFRQVASDTGAPEWVLCANADAVPSAGLLAALAEDAVGPFDLVGFATADGARSRRLVPSWRNSLATIAWRETRALSRRGEDEHYPVGACLAIRRSAFEALGGFSDAFSLYYEEIDLWVRARRMGLRIGFADPRLTYEHIGAASTSLRASAAAFELGRSATLYNRRNRHAERLGPWLLTEVLRLAILAARAVMRRNRVLIRTHVCTLAGLAAGVITPKAALRWSDQRFAWREAPAARPTALFVMFEDPRTGRSGSALRNTALLDALVARYDVTCLVMSGRVCSASPAIGVRFVAGARRGPVATGLRAILRRQQWMTARYDTRTTRRVLRHELPKAEIALASMINSAEIVARAALRLGHGHPLIWDTQNFDPELWRVSAAASRWPRRVMARREERLAVRNSAWLHNRVAGIVAVSERDLQAWQRLAGRTPVWLVPNAARDEWFTVGDRPPTKGVIASFGSLGQSMTSDGLVDFLQNHWPEVHRSLPGTRLLLVGRDPTPALLDAAGHVDAVTIVANPSDIVRIVSQAEILIFPQVRGYGSKVKLYEALATGRAVVASDDALVGIPVSLLTNVIRVTTSWPDAISAAQQLPRRTLTEDEKQRLGNCEVARTLHEMLNHIVAQDEPA